MPNKNKPLAEFDYQFLSTTNLPRVFDKSMSFFKRYLRSGELIEGVHYMRAPSSSSLLWNVTLLLDWFACGGNTPAHQKAIEKYLKSLASNAA
jgi:hypothetical protein